MPLPTEPAALPLVRDCPPGGLRPLLAPGGRENYFSPDLQRILFDVNEPLSRFLPPAKWQVPDRVDRSKSPQVAYSIPDEIIKTAQPLTTLPRAEIEAFVAAVRAFLAKGELDAKGVPPFIRQCRAEFRLPNPAVDPLAYWIYGPEFDRRLLILWGCEAPGGPSLSLDKAVEAIREREMAWTDKQELQLKMAKADPKLGRFLAPRGIDGALTINGTAVPAQKLKRLGQISPREWRAFDDAARGFYARAHPDVADAPPFEKELRRDFRLPGPDTVPGDYYRSGSHFVIAIDRWPKEKTLPLTDDPILRSPEDTAKAAEPTVSAQLKRREQPPYVRYTKVAAALAAVAVIALLGWMMRPDHTKPTLAQNDPAVVRDPSTVVLSFSEPVVIPPPSPAPPDRPDTPPLLSFFGNVATIKSATVDPASPRTVLIVTDAPLRDGEKYGISITGVTDRSGNVIEPTSAEFTYFDARPPELKVDEITADTLSNKRLLFTFTKPISEASLNPSNFMIYDAVDGGRRVPLANVYFEPDTKDHTVVAIEAQDDWTGNKWYRFDLGNVTDASAHPNRVREIPEANRRFQYVDKLPPRIREVIANGGEGVIEVQFSKPIEREPALALDNYVVTDPAGSPLKLLPGGTKLNENGDVLTLRLQSGKLSTGRHTLKVLKLADAKGRTPLTKPVERPFQFNDAVNPAPPRPKDRPDADKLTKGATQLDLAFDRGLPRDGTVTPARFRLCDRDHRPLANEVVAVNVSEENPSRVSLKLKESIDIPGEYTIETNGLSDVFGTPQTQPFYARFKVKGFVVLRSSSLDWKQAPLLQGGRRLVLTLTERVTKTSAQDLSHYHLQPAVPIARLEDFKLGNEDNPTTVIILQLQQPVKETLTVSVDGLILSAMPSDGPQSLPPVNAQANM